MQTDWVFEGNSLEKLKAAQRRERKLQRRKSKMSATKEARKIKHKSARREIKEQLNAY